MLDAQGIRVMWHLCLACMHISKVTKGISPNGQNRHSSGSTTEG
jgi:hypothetical protein